MLQQNSCKARKWKAKHPGNQESTSEEPNDGFQIAAGQLTKMWPVQLKQEYGEQSKEGLQGKNKTKRLSDLSKHLE